MKLCTIRLYSKNSPCQGKIEWHHVWTYGGKQIQEVWSIVAACQYHHDLVKKDRRVKEMFERASLEFSTEEELGKYPKKDWGQVKRYLTKNYPQLTNSYPVPL
jgi:hypothetical protein